MNLGDNSWSSPGCYGASVRGTGMMHPMKYRELLCFREKNDSVKLEMLRSFSKQHVLLYSAWYSLLTYAKISLERCR